MTDDDGIEKSCKTCDYYNRNVQGERIHPTSAECQKHINNPENIPPLHSLKSFPFDNGCKYWKKAFRFDQDRIEEYIEYHEQEGS